jgi:hypothetical protein
MAALVRCSACRANHGNIFGTSVGLELRKYRYFNSQTRGLDYQVHWITAITKECVHEKECVGVSLVAPTEQLCMFRELLAVL